MHGIIQQFVVCKQEIYGVGGRTAGGLGGNYDLKPFRFGEIEAGGLQEEVPDII